MLNGRKINNKKEESGGGGVFLLKNKKKSRAGWGSVGESFVVMEGRQVETCVLREHEAGVEEDVAVARADEHAVHADFSEPAQRENLDWGIVNEPSDV